MKVLFALAACVLSLTATAHAVTFDAPTNVTAMPGDASAVVSFTAPLNDGGASIISYTAIPFIGAIAQPSTTDNSCCTIDLMGLTNGTIYTVASDCCVAATYQHFLLSPGLTAGALFS